MRKEIGTTQQEIADMQNITRAAYSNIENGKRETNFTILTRLSDYFQVSIDYLLEKTDDPGFRVTDMIPNNKSAAEKIGDDIKQIFVDAGMIKPDEELTDDFKEYAMNLLRTAIAFDKRVNDTQHL